VSVIYINKNTVKINRAFKEALGGKAIVCSVKNSVVSLPFNTLDVVDGILGENVQAVTDRNATACICLVGIVCHLLCEDRMILEIFLNTDNVNAAVVEHFAHVFLSFGNNLAVLIKL